MPAQEVPDVPLFCASCDPLLAADVAALPVEYQRKVVAAVRRLTEFYARASGIDLPSEVSSPANVVELRLFERPNPL